MRRSSSNFYDPKFRANRERWRMEEMLGEWYGNEFAHTEVAAHGAQPRRLGAVLDVLLAEKLTPRAHLSLAIRERWDELIGPPLNRYAQFCRLEDDCAIVEISHPAFLRELNQPRVIAEWCDKLNREFPGAGLKTIRFIPAAGKPQP